MTPGKTVIKYSDPNQTKTFDDTPGSAYVATPLGLADSDTFLERDETFEIKLIGIEAGGTNGLTNNLTVSTKFSIEVIPPLGATLHIERTTPGTLHRVDSLD